MLVTSRYNVLGELSPRFINVLACADVPITVSQVLIDGSVVGFIIRELVGWAIISEVAVEVKQQYFVVAAIQRRVMRDVRYHARLVGEDEIERAGCIGSPCTCGLGNVLRHEAVAGALNEECFRRVLAASSRAG